MDAIHKITMQTVIGIDPYYFPATVKDPENWEYPIDLSPVLSADPVQVTDEDLGVGAACEDPEGNPNTVWQLQHDSDVDISSLVLKVGGVEVAGATVSPDGVVRALIEATDSATASYTVAGCIVPKQYWKIDGGAVVEMNAGEKTEKDAAKLDKIKAEKAKVFKKEHMAWVAQWYDPATSGYINSLYTEAVRKGYGVRAAMIEEIQEWVKTTLVERYMASAAAKAATNEAAVHAVTMNLAQFEASRPGYEPHELAAQES